MAYTSYMQKLFLQTVIAILNFFIHTDHIHLSSFTFMLTVIGTKL